MNQRKEPVRIGGPLTLATLGAMLLLLADCQHARVQLPVRALPVPAACTGRVIVNRDCNKAKLDLQNKRDEQLTEERRREFVYHHKYLFWGLKPPVIAIDVTKLCPIGVKEIYEYSSVKDGLLENLTFGIYCPKTLKITCY